MWFSILKLSYIYIYIYIYDDVFPLINYHHKQYKIYSVTSPTVSRLPTPFATHRFTNTHETTSNQSRGSCITTHTIKHIQPHTIIRKYNTHTYTQAHKRLIRNSNINLFLTLSFRFLQFLQNLSISVSWLSYKEGMKPLVSDKHPSYQIFVKTNTYLFIYHCIIALSLIREHSPNYIKFFYHKPSN